MAGALEVLRPFAWLATIAFLVGFVSYLALAEPSVAVAQEELAQPIQASGPVSDDWRAARHI